MATVAGVDGGESRPVVAIKVGDDLRLGEFTDEQHQGHTTGDGVRDGLEDKEGGDHVGLDDHDHARHSDHEEGQDVEGAQRLKDVPGRAQQGAALVHAKHIGEGSMKKLDEKKNTGGQLSHRSSAARRNSTYIWLVGSGIAGSTTEVIVVVGDDEESAVDARVRSPDVGFCFEKKREVK